MTIEYDRLQRLRQRHLTAAGNSVALPVMLAATSVTVAFPRAEPDANYGVGVTPNWNTTVWVTGKLTTGCTVNFGTGAPSGAAVDVVTFRSE